MARYEGENSGFQFGSAKE